MSAEAIATFTVDGGDHTDGAPAVADLIAAHMPPAIEWRRATPIGTGVRVELRVGRRTVPAFIGPTASDSPDVGRWFVSVGSGTMPLARMLGGKDRDLRAGVAAALRDALLASPRLVDVEFTGHD